MNHLTEESKKKLINLKCPECGTVFKDGEKDEKLFIFIEDDPDITMCCHICGNEKFEITKELEIK